MSLRTYIARLRDDAIERCQWNAADESKRGYYREGFICLDIGCGDCKLTNTLLLRDGEHWAIDAGARPTWLDPRCRFVTVDLNTPWRGVPSEHFTTILSNQVIEHLHDTRMFLAECRRVLVPGGNLILTTENLASWQNVAALIMGWAPFSTQQVCGWYLGNPAGLHVGENTPERWEPDEPTASGRTGHVRVMPARQLREVVEKSGLKVTHMESTGFFPLPYLLDAILSTFSLRGHYITVHARKETT